LRDERGNGEEERGKQNFGRWRDRTDRQGERVKGEEG